MKDKNDTKARKYQLTINNPDNDFSHEKIKEISVLKLKSFLYGAMTDEQGSCYHTHIFLCFRSPVRFSTLKNLFPAAHIEKVKGSINDNVTYLKKEGKWENTDKAETTIQGTFEEWGERPPESMGKRADLAELYRMIVDEELSNAEIIAINQDFIIYLDKMDKIRMSHLQNKYCGTRRLDLEVIYVFGETGTGKSRNILDEYGDEHVYRVTDYQHPFDSYECQPVIVFEEFRSSLPLGSMLNYLDIYPIQLPARYSNRYACYTTVFICTNWELEKQYQVEQEKDKESWNALLRRIKKIRHFTDPGKYTEYDSPAEYFQAKEDHETAWRTLDEQLKIPMEEIPFY